MADKKMIKYGDKTIEMPDGMTLDQAKQQMARFFPELAEPEVKAEKKNDKTIYIFSKKAGRKGAANAPDDLTQFRNAEDILDRACVERIDPDGERIRTLDERVQDIVDQLRCALNDSNNLRQNEMEAAMMTICSHNGVGGAMLWVSLTDDGPQFLGALLDDRNNRISNSVTWNPHPSISETLDCLVFIAENYAAPQR